MRVAETIRFANASSFVYPLTKRATDMIVSLVALGCLCVPMVVIALLIRLDSPGSALYSGVRIGRNGVPFRMHKFRTMIVGADHLGGSSTPDDDPRLTRLGSWLRQFKLDELPQLLNVLLGEMSLVGPRPQVPWAVALYSAEERELLSVLPGMTDYASLRFPDEGRLLRGSADPDRTYAEAIHPEKMRLSLIYVRTRSLSVDLSILARTPFAIFRD